MTNSTTSTSQGAPFTALRRWLAHLSDSGRVVTTDSSLGTEHTSTSQARTRYAYTASCATGEST